MYSAPSTVNSNPEVRSVLTSQMVLPQRAGGATGLKETALVNHDQDLIVS